MREICINVVRASARVQRKEVRERVKTCIISSGSNYRQIRSEGFITMHIYIESMSIFKNTWYFKL